VQVPAQVEYERATSVSQALALLARYGPDARILAGGHSLIPMMKLRLVQPEVLIDINGITGLRYITKKGGTLHIGTLARHADLLNSTVAGEHFAILWDAERVIADPIVREWGTIGGSLCQADPSEDLSAAFAALKGTMVIAGPNDIREIPARHFHAGPYETCLGSDEMLTEIRLPVRPGPFGRLAGWCRRRGALAGAPARRGWPSAHPRRRDRPHGTGGEALRGGGGRGVPAREAGH
jgi:aerobic carbon-monoxide dehydrogenase medium subunit